LLPDSRQTIHQRLTYAAVLCQHLGIHDDVDILRIPAAHTEPSRQRSATINRIRPATTLRHVEVPGKLGVVLENGDPQPEFASAEYLSETTENQPR